MGLGFVSVPFERGVLPAHVAASFVQLDHTLPPLCGTYAISLGVPCVIFPGYVAFDPGY